MEKDEWFTTRRIVEFENRTDPKSAEVEDEDTGKLIIDKETT